MVCEQCLEDMMSVNVEAPTDEKVDKWGFTIKPKISDDLLMLRCLQNAPCGSDRKQAMRLIKIYEEKIK